MSNLSAETLGFGTVLEKGSTADHTTATFSAMCTELVDITPPEYDTDDVKTKHMTSANQVETFVPGWGKMGDVKFKANFSPSEYAALVAIYRVPKAFRITFAGIPYGGGSSTSATGDIIKWNGYLKTIGTPVDLDGLVQVEGTIKVSGLPALA